ncbi:type II secretion system F family protein [Alkalibacillus haloalkaliphilus]|uniref:type II secretion system F family protein n=1 Tax=Alkalibacillus haloalkaliphilus TaxID=94136 RepID=UPI002935ABE4|nr:type II secretion system F family protein [Alkalibacillus haloalkaliphilus]MDV2581858.1 type II secretion system F family protein [Alkalibacillus haloalkaliphilus]
MASFKYIAADYNGNEKQGKLEAYNIDLAKARLRDEGLKIESIEEVKQSIWTKDIHFGNPVKNRDFVVFLQQFAALLKAGLTIVDSLNVLREQTKQKQLKAALYYVEIDMRQGSSLTNSLKKHPEIFSNIFVNMVHSGESSGSLEETLSKLADYYHKHYKTSQKVKSTFAYPVAVGLVAIGVVIFLMMYVVPEFIDMFSQFDASLPIVTQVVLGISNLLTSYWYLFGLIALLFSLILIMVLQRDHLRKKVDYYLLKSPGFGSLILKSNMASMTRTLSSLLYNNVPIIQALQLTEQTLKNKVIKQTLQDAESSLKQGASLVKPLRQHWAYPYLVTQMIEVGEKTNSLPDMLGQVATFYEDDVDTATDQLKSLLEPLLIITLSVIVGTIVLAIVIPMFELFNQIN